MIIRFDCTGLNTIRQTAISLDDDSPIILEHMFKNEYGYTLKYIL